MTRYLALAAVLAVTSMPRQACNDGSSRRPGGGQPVIETFTTSDGVKLGVQVLATNLILPWSMAFAPDGRLFFTERTGAVRLVQDDVLLQEPVLQLTDVNVAGEGGLLGIALHPAFAQNHYVYLFYTANGADGRPINRLVRYRESANTLGERAVLMDNLFAAGSHHGGRIAFGPDGKLYVTVGDARVASLAQSLSAFNGKVLRLNDDGTTPADNPYGSPVWTLGHRNPQGIAWHPRTRALWSTEHGETDKDELNLLRPGLNYGWPVIEGDATMPGMEVPARFYTPGLAPSGMSFYGSPAIPAFRHDLFFATLRGQHIHRVTIDVAGSPRIVTEELWLERKFGRIRDIVIGPDGAIYFCTSNRDGSISAVATDDRLARIVPVR